MSFLIPCLLIPSLAPATISAAVFADAETVVVASQDGVRVLSWPDRKVRKTLTTELAHVHDLAFSPDHTLLAMAGGTPGEEGRLEIVRWPSGELVKRWQGHDDLVTALAWSADGKRLVSASADGGCQVWDTATFKAVTTFKGHAGSVLAVQWMPDDKHVISAGVDQSLRLWDAATGKVVRSMENHTKTVNALALRPGQAADAVPVVVSGGSDKTVRWWQPTVGRLMKIKRLPSAVLAVAWTDDGQQVVASGTDGVVRVIDADSLEVVAEHKVFEGWVPTLAMRKREVLTGGEQGQIARWVLPAASRP